MNNNICFKKKNKETKNFQDKTRTKIRLMIKNDKSLPLFLTH